MPNHHGARRGAAAGTIEGASLVAAWSFAVTGPILDLLGRHPQFFVAHRATTLQILWLSLGLGLLAPLVLAAVVAAIRQLHPSGGSVAWGVSFTVLAGSFTLVVLHRFLASDPSAVAAAASLGIALLCGVVSALLIRRSSAARSFFLFLTPAPLVMLAVFFLATPMSRLFAASGTLTPQGVVIGNPADVVILVYDELPIVSLLDSSGGIDPLVFPNFARLASHATLYRNTTTVSDDTTWAIPSLLSGLYPQRPGRLPITTDHPNTLFTLLRGAYSISCLEPVTRLCPEAARLPAETEHGASSTAMLSDLRILWLHLVLPARFTTSLPSIDQGWAHFTASPPEAARDEPRRALTPEEIVAVASSDRRAQFSSFLQMIEPTTEPTLHFGHLLLPHKPYRFLPAGQRYVRTTQPDPSSVGGPWLDSAWAKSHERQRHQLQTDYVDISLGDLLDRLQATGRYDDTLLLVTADHGVAFVPGSHRRIASHETLGEIAWVPLLVKTPHQREGKVSDEPMRLVDVLPLIAQALDIELPWKIDGRPAGASTDVAVRRLLSPMGGDFELPLSTAERDRALQRKVALFGRSPGVKRHFQIGADGHLVGSRASDLPQAEESRFRALYDRPGELRRVSLAGAGFFPAYLGGDLEPTSPPSDGRWPRLAAAINGRIAGVGRATPTQRGRVRFAIFLWPEPFRNGRNDLDLYEIRGQGDTVELRRIPRL